MEILQASLPLFFAFLLFLYMVVVRLRSEPKSQIPPGPRKLPLIGNIHQLTGSLPHHSLRNLARKYGPVMHLQLGEVSAVIISSREAAKDVMKTHDLSYANRPQIIAAKIMAYDCAGVAFAPYGDYWRQIRKLCTLELLSSKRVLSFRPLREEEVQNLIESISSSTGVPINFSKMITSVSTAITSRAVFGKKTKDKDELILALKEASQLGGGFDVPDIFPSLKFLHRISRVKPRLEKLHIKVDEILDKIIDEHKVKRETGMSSNEEPVNEDLVDVLLKLQESGDLEFPITIDNIKATIVDIFTAGTETSSTTIDWAMSEMIRNPKIMEKAQTEVRDILKGKSKVDEADIHGMNYLKLIVKETLRLHPALPLLLPREARERCEVNGYDVPIRTKIIINAWAMGRDPEYWKNPECFEPDRFNGSSIEFKGANFEYIPFGAGRRMCPGISFGIASIELQLAQLLHQFNWKLPNGMKPEELDMTEAFGASVTRKSDLHLIATPYIP